MDISTTSGEVAALSSLHTTLEEIQKLTPSKNGGLWFVTEFSGIIGSR